MSSDNNEIKTDKNEKVESSEDPVKVLPVRVVVEYCAICGYGGNCLKLTRLIHNEYSNVEVICRRGRQGSFEIAVNNIPVYSKLDSKILPELDDVLTVVKSASEGRPINKINNYPSFSCVIS